MPNNFSPDDLNSQIARINQRVSRLENTPQIGNSSIQAGGLQILDPTGKIVMVIGYQENGALGVSTFNPTTGAPVISLGQDPSGVPGLSVYDPSGNREVQLGEISTSPVLYGLAVLDPTHAVMQRVGGISVAVANGTQFTTSTSYVTFSDDPSVPVTIGPSGQAEISYGSHIGTGGDNDEGRAALTVDGVMAGVNEYIDVSCGGAGVGVASSVSKTSLLTGLTPGSHTFSLQYFSLTGVHGISVRQRFVAVNPL